MPKREMSGCSIRALWILNSQETVVFSRRFPVVEKRWRLACQRDTGVSPLLPTDPEIAAAVAVKKKREGSLRGFGIRVSQSSQGSDSWTDDPITRHIVTLYINRKEDKEYLLWPVVLHIKEDPIVEIQRSVDKTVCPPLYSISLASQGITCHVIVHLAHCYRSFIVAHALGDIITGELVDPEIVASSSPSVHGLLDSLTGSIGIPSIAARAKPSAAPVGVSTASGASAGPASSDTPKNVFKPIDKDALRMFISGSMPFGTPLEFNASNIFAIKANGFSSSDVPASDLKQPAWKPYLYKGKQRLFFTVNEVIYAAMYDRDDVPDSISVSGQVNCRADLEGLPDVSLPLSGVNTANTELLSFHPCAQVSEQGSEKQALMFSPPLGNFVLLRYQSRCSIGPPVKGFYQLSMISEDEGAFLFKLRLMEGYKSPLSMEFCTVTMPFPRRRLASCDGTPSLGTVLMTDHSIEWKIIPSGRGISGRSVEATFSGTVKFLPISRLRISSLPQSGLGNTYEEEIDLDPKSTSNMINIEEYLMEKMNKDLHAVDLEEPLSWQAYNYAKVSFKISGETISGVSIDPKSVRIYPALKVPTDLSMQASAGDYILWNTLGKCPVAATPKY